MHHSSVKSIFVEEKNKLNNGGNNVPPICPKPRRPAGSTIPEFLKSLNYNDNSQKNFDGRSGILNIVADKTRDGRKSSSCYSGSPPGRTDNPLVHDVQFIQQMEHFSPLTRTNLSDKFGFTSVSPA